MVLCDPKHVGTAFIILTVSIIYGFYNLCALVDNKVFDIIDAWCEHDVHTAHVGT